MPKMFGFSRRGMKLGRLKVQLSDPSQVNRSPVRPSKKSSKTNEEKEVFVSTSGGSDDDYNCRFSSAPVGLNSGVGSYKNWTPWSTEGTKPSPRSNHAAALVGSKMVVVGGDSGHGLLGDTMLLSLDCLTWAAASPKIYYSSNDTSTKIPACKGHVLVPWGNLILLVGGKTDPSTEKVAVWSFNVETECWSRVETKGDIPVSRSGHTATRAGTVLILFGGEDVKGRKLHDLHMFDLKSSTWLPLHYKGTGPSPRSNHVATLYDDKTLFVFGGQSKSRMLNDLYSLDFEKMVWSRIKTRGHQPSPRAGCCGALCGTKWYIAGGGSKRKRHAETLVFDVKKLEWTISVTSPSASVTANRGFSVVPVHHKDKILLVAFGGLKKEPSNQVEILFLVNNEHSSSWRSAPELDLLPYVDCHASSEELNAYFNNGVSPSSIDRVARHSLASAVEQQISGRRSLSDDPNSISSNVPHHKQFHQKDALPVKIQKTLEDEIFEESSNQLASDSPSQILEQRSKRQETVVQMDIAGVLASSEVRLLESGSPNTYLKTEDKSFTSDNSHPKPSGINRTVLTEPSSMYHLYDARIAAMAKKNVLLEEQLKAALASREAADRNLSSVVRIKQEMESKLADATKEAELLKEKLAEMELAQEEANNLSNDVHSDNVRLEHDVAFLKAILEVTQKELHSTQTVLAAERARAFQLQVEVFHLKQRLQTTDHRGAPTPRKPFHM